MFDEINTHLFVERKPITYKYLARWKDLSSSKAKQVLQEFYDQFKHEKPDLSSYYTVTGRAGNTRYVKIVSGQDIEIGKAELEKVDSVSIYSLNMGKVALDTVVAINTTIEKEYTPENCTRWGVIQTGTAQKVAKKQEREVARPSQRNAMSEPLKTEAKPQEARPAAKDISTSRLGSLYTSRKKAPETKNQAKRALDWPKESTEPPKKKTKNEVKAKLTQLFENSDDDMDYSEEEPNDEPLDVVNPAETEIADQQKPAKRADKPADKQKSEPATEKVEENAAPPEPVYDEEGYLVTTKQQPAKRSATHPPAKKGHTISKNTDKANTKKQVSLMSFFGKKK
ncbi:hypothetical protein KL930_003042 [Ogataea haglerorum]|uniref:DNA polymerase delta subunit 3 n=1 Tax=Ogataea haglerorum TaxID=1937702 RepID=A0AAN6D601_9ASCO|nr:uncharacterized protein KL911_002704 [Ogataea haglerorum]KAG7693995.1 hypothetical protein KL915_003666 [Ogataea haglerorum]KAG7694699.1 hypothetical protein KL951_003876 [Ogataea haglerorum]KAG7704743.1 hypothetical protein KL914_004134 [Ogataea haglerorum]KAG7704818.1 hypothetical protein KL950_003991 [Ogataea haglerorum]KAG7719198.1 hypothetical protein KL913_002196 [Ogataea haglerorum]